MSNLIVPGQEPNVFQRYLVPLESSWVRGTMCQAADSAQSENILVRHVVSTACAVAAIALSTFKTISYMLQIPFQLLLNIVRFDPAGLVFDFARTLSNATRSLLMAAFGATYIASGILFPEEVYGFFKPVSIQTAERALEKKETELQAALSDVKEERKEVANLLAIAQGKDLELEDTKEKLKTTLPQVEELNQEFANLKSEFQTALEEKTQALSKKEQELGTQKSEIEKLENQHRETMEVDLKASLKKLQEKRAEAASVLENAQQKDLKPEITPQALSQELANLKSEFQTALKERTQALSEKEQELKTQQSEIKKLQNQLKETEEQAKTTRWELTKEQEKSSSLERRIISLESPMKEQQELEGSAELLSRYHAQLEPKGPVDEKLAQELAPVLSKAVVQNAQQWVVPQPAEEIKMDGSYVFVESMNEENLLELTRRELNFKGQANLIPYLHDAFEGNQILKDNQPITFDLENGKILSKEDVMAARIFCQLLRETYGFNAAERVIQLYKLGELQSLTFLDVKKAMVGLAANVKVSDLKALFDDLKKEKPSRLMALLIPENEKKIICEFESFDRIPPHHEALHLLLKAFRTLPIPDPSQESAFRTPVFNILAEEKKESQDFREFDQYIHDLKVLSDSALPFAVEQRGIKTKLPESLGLETAEHFAKNIGYRELNPGNIAVQFGNELFELVDEIEQNGDAVFCRLYAPINAKAGKEADPLHVHLVMRGTQTTPSSQASGASLARDVEVSGVGKASFNLRANDMKKMLTDYLEQIPEKCPVALSLDGHSLGACDAMRLAVVIAQLFKERPDLAAKVVKVYVNPQNSPSLDPATNNEFSGLLKDLEIKLPGREGLFDLTISLFDKDPVQRIAYGVYLGAKISSSLLKCRAILLKPPEDFKEGIHGAKPFTEHADIPFEIKVVDETEQLKPHLEKTDYKDPDAGLLEQACEAITSAIVQLTFTTAHVGFVNPLVRATTYLGGAGDWPQPQQ